MRLRRRCLINAVYVLILYTPMLFASPQTSSIDQVIDSLFRIREFQKVAISPDGTQVAWVESLHGPHGEPTPKSVIYVQALHSAGPARRVTAATNSVTCSEGEVAWSPDGRQLAFLSDKDQEGQMQLYVADVAGGSSRKL